MHNRYNSSLGFATIDPKEKNDDSNVLRYRPKFSNAQKARGLGRGRLDHRFEQTKLNFGSQSVADNLSIGPDDSVPAIQNFSSFNKRDNGSMLDVATRNAALARNNSQQNR